MKKRFDRLLLCGLLVCSLAIPAGFADEDPDAGISQETTAAPTQAPAAGPTKAPDSEPVQEPTAEPTAEPTQQPTAEPSREPSEEPSREPSQQPTSEPTVEPSDEPTQQPTAEPSQEPSEQPSQQPTAEPSPEPTPETTLAPSESPAVTPEPTVAPPLPGSIDGLVEITPEGIAVQENDVWKIQLSVPDSPVSFAWTVSGEASGYLVYVQAAGEDARFIAETAQARIDLSSADYANGRYTLYVGAVLADGSVTWGKAVFEMASQQGGFPGGGFPGGSRPGGSASMGAIPQQEQGFRVTPGEALTSKHASGTKDTTAYTASEIDDSAEAIAALYLSSTQTEITLDDGAFFRVSEEDGKLSLIPEGDGQCWRLSVLAMNTLAESGINRVVFHTGSISYSLPAQMELSGSVYASLRAKGYVSKDMEIRIDEQGIRVYAAGGIYSIGDQGELLPYGE